MIQEQKYCHRLLENIMAPTMMSQLSPFLNSQSSDLLSLENARASPTNSNMYGTPFSYFYHPMNQSNDATPIAVSANTHTHTHIQYIRLQNSSLIYSSLHRHNPIIWSINFQMELHPATMRHLFKQDHRYWLVLHLIHNYKSNRRRTK